MRRFVIFIAYDHSRSKKALNFLRQSNHISKICIVDNEGSLSLGSYNEVLLIKGSNKNHEFSGWQEGLKKIQDVENISKDDEIIFMNDTVFAHHKIPRFIWKSFVKFTVNNSALGFESKISGGFSLNNFYTESWLSTFLFKLNYSSLCKMNCQIDYGETLDKYVVKSFGKSFLNLEDKNLEKHILAWLFSGGWYASEKLTERNFDSFRKKTLCILNEKYFSCMLNNQNIKIVNILPRRTFSWYKNKILCKLNISIIR